MFRLAYETSGHAKVEVDIEITDNNSRSHRCRFYVKSELGLIEQLGISLKNLITTSVRKKYKKTHWGTEFEVNGIKYIYFMKRVVLLQMMKYS